MIRPVALFLMAILLAGCSKAPPPAPAAQPDEPRASESTPAEPEQLPADAPLITKTDAAVRIQGLDSFSGGWTWSPDGARIGLLAQGVIWSIRPDGSQLEALVRSSGELNLLGWIDQGLIYAETVAGQPKISAVGQTGRVREYPLPAGLAQTGNLWYRLLGDRLLLLVDSRPAAVVSLDTGETREIAGWETWEPIEEGPTLRPSEDDRYVAYSARTSRGEAALFLIDMEAASAITVTPGWAIPPLIDWSGENRWAAATVVRSEGDGGKVTFTLSLHAGTPDGQFRALPPPEPLAVTIPYPYWSPDGTLIAVTAQEESGPRKAQAPQAIWIVDTRSGAWTKAGVITSASLAGWADGTHVLISELGAWRTLSISNGQTERIPLTLKPVPASGQSGVYAEFQPDHTWTLFRQRPGEERKALAAGLGPPNRLAVRGSYVALDPTEPGLPVLLIINMDNARATE